MPCSVQRHEGHHRAILLPFVDYLALVVPLVANHTEPYLYHNRLMQALYAEQAAQRHLPGILVVGY
jgi:hypothetical protein